MKPREHDFKAGVGVDIGTMNLLSARQTVQGKVVTSRIRDAFIDLDPDAKRSLKMSKVNYVEKDGNLIVIGDSALNLANLFKREVRRPLSRGVISPGEHDAQEMLSLLIFEVIGEPIVDKEHAYYSVPAAPIDDLDQDVVYHTEIFRKILSEHGYTPHATNEALAIIYSQCAEENFSGLAVSYGAGMVNVALAYQTVMGMSFSLSRSGDWVDSHAAKALGSTSARVCALKEKGVNLASPSSREEEALVLYIRSLIQYSLENIATQFRRVQATLDLPDPVPFVISGGTSRAGGFMEVFKEEFQAINKRGFPFKISEVRQAKDPMTAVSEGLLVLALQEHEE